MQRDTKHLVMMATLLILTFAAFSVIAYFAETDAWENRADQYDCRYFGKVYMCN